jgi:hypothetical protein
VRKCGKLPRCSPDESTFRKDPSDSRNRVFFPREIELFFTSPLWPDAISQKEHMQKVPALIRASVRYQIMGERPLVEDAGLNTLLLPLRSFDLEN